MDQLKKLEVPLAKIVKSLPVLPKDVKDKVVVALPWVALVFGILELVLVWGLLDFMNTYGKVERLFSTFGIEVSTGLSSFDKMLIFIGVAVLAASAGIGLMAFAPLKERKPKGWYLLFLAVIINLGYAVFSLFIKGQGVGSLLVSTLQSALGLYLLFQVRDYFKTTKTLEQPKDK